MAAPAKMNILIVDDRPEQRLSLAAALADLYENVVQVASGRDALRELLHREFAVILLDVNMPGLDGFETAALIRQRRSSEHTPIIFITANSDDAHAMRGYSLGAVDYILTPVEPQVLRTKVGVFVELSKKNEEVKRQAASLRQRAAQLHALTEASHALNSELSLNGMLQMAIDWAAAIVGTHQAVINTAVNQYVATRPFICLSDAYASWRSRRIALATAEIAARAEHSTLPIRLTTAELDDRHNRSEHPAAADQLPMRGWLAAALTGQDGRRLGLIQLSDKLEGEFTEDDEAALIQLAQMTSIAFENIVYRQEREANRLKDEFLATLSHELRAPLQAILLWTHMLRRAEGLDDATAAHGLSVIARSATAQAKLIEDLLDVSRIINDKIRLEPAPLDLVQAVRVIIEAIRPVAAESGVELISELGSTSCAAMADEHRLQQIISNLLSNAVKFTPKGGHVRVQFAEQNGRARIRISDTGKGIPLEFLPHIFERFRQADSSTARAQSGLGIGLFIVRRLAELHGGTVVAESAGEGHGATFTVDLPVLRDPVSLPIPANGADHALTPLRPDGGIRLDGVRLVVVDNEVDARDGLALVLRQSGARVVPVGSAVDALAAIEDTLPDALICDIGMPGEDGYALIHKVRARPPERGGRVPAAAVTAYARSEDCARALAAGFDAHVSKPIEPAELMQTLKGLISKSKRV